MKPRGFTLLEVIVVMAIIAILSGIMVPFVYRIWEKDEIDLTRQRMLDLKRALVGDSRMIQNGIRTSYGFVGDHGQLPSKDQIWTAIVSYMPAGYDPNKFSKDAWGNEIVYEPDPADAAGRLLSAKLRSYGPNGKLDASEPSDDIADSDLQITNSEVAPADSVQGNLNFIFNNATGVTVTLSAVKIFVVCNGVAPPITTGCIPFDSIQAVPEGEQASFNQSLKNNGALIPKLPIGKSVFKTILYANNTCSDSGFQSANEWPVFIHDAMKAAYVNLSYTVNLP